MNDIFNPFQDFSIVYIDDALIFSQNIDQHFKHLQTFFTTIKRSGLVVSKQKIKLFQIKIRFLGFEIYLGLIKPFKGPLSLPQIFRTKLQIKPNYKDFWDVSIMCLISFKI